MRFRLPVLGACVAVVLTAHGAHAEPLQWHAEAGSARAVGGWQGYEYGSGGGGSAAVEYPFVRALGLQLEVGGLWLPHVNPPQEATVASNSDASAFGVMAGLRLHPFGTVAGPWLDLNGGYVRSGADDTPGFDTHLGWDWRVDEGRLDVGPYVGYLQAFGPSSALRPSDAHVVSIGLHVALGAERPRVFLAKAGRPPAPPPAPAPPPQAAPSDRDGDGIPDATDACPDVVGVATDDPATNGCPLPVMRVVDDHIEYDEIILFDTDSPKVRPESHALVARLAKFISEHPDIGKVAIEGHADERGPDDYNLVLSRARARSVRALLIHFGVDAVRLSAEAFGESKPRAQGHTEQDWAQNRRVEFVITRAPAATAGSTSLGAMEKQK